MNNEISKKKKIGITIALVIMVFTVIWGASCLYEVFSSFPKGEGLKGFATFKLKPNANLMNPFHIFSVKKVDEATKNMVEIAWAVSIVAHFALFFMIAMKMQKRPSLYGDARFASAKEIEQAGLFVAPPPKNLAQADLDKIPPAEYLRHGLFAGEKIIVGKYGDRYIGLGGQLFGYLAAPTRSGKGVGVVIPVGLSYAHSMVVSDIKQELFELTAPYRARCGHEIYLFDPFNVEGRTARWNPLTYVSRDHARRVDDLNQIAISLIPDSGGDDSFFEDSARKLFIGIGLWLLDREQFEHSEAEEYYNNLLEQWEENKKLVIRAEKHNRLAAGKREKTVQIVSDPNAWNKLSETNKNYQHPQCPYIDSLIEEEQGEGLKIPQYVANFPKPEAFKKHPAPTIRGILDQCTAFTGEAIPHFNAMCSDVFTTEIAKQTINSSTSAGDKTFASILATLTSNLTPWLSEPVANATSGDDFDLRDVRKRKMTIYIGIQPKDLQKASKIINLFYSQLINENTATLPQNDPSLKYQCLMLMDEGTAAGRIAVLEKAISYMAGYNMRLLFIAQSPAQLEDRKVYGETGARNILTNIALKVLYKPNDVKDSEEYSKLLGKITVKEDTSASRGGGNKGTSRTESVQQRDLMMPQELREMEDNKEIIIFTGIRHPIMCNKNKYYEDPIFRHYKGHGEVRYQSLREAGLVEDKAEVIRIEEMEDFLARSGGDEFINAHCAQALAKLNAVFNDEAQPLVEIDDEQLPDVLIDELLEEVEDVALTQEGRATAK